MGRTPGRVGVRACVTVGLAATVLLGTGAPAGAAAPEPATELVVTFVAPGMAQAVLDDTGVDAPVDLPGAQSVAVELTRGEAAALDARPEVLAVEENTIYEAAEAPNDPGYTQGLSYWVDQLGFPLTWGFAKSSPSVVVAVVDTAVQTTHPDLQGKVDLCMPLGVGNCGTDGIRTFVTSGARIRTHGTAVAGLAAAATDNAFGIPGAGWNAHLRSYEALTDNGAGGTTGTLVAIVNAIDAAIADGVEVINLSLTTTSTDAAMQAAVNRALNAGISVVAAAGNVNASSGPGPFFPAQFAGVLSVGASTPAEVAASFSARAGRVDVYAPGTDLVAPTDGSTFAAGIQGTSFASPIVAGTVALLRAREPGLNPAQIAARIAAGTVPLLDGAGRRLQSGMAVLGAPVGIGTVGIFGSLEPVQVGLGSITFGGWAIDPSTTDPIAVHAYVDGSPIGSVVAGQSRPDVGAALPGFGSLHGYTFSTSISTGTHQVCTYGINVGAGANATLGCRTVVLGGSPVGSLDAARQVPGGGVRILGWALDPDRSASIGVHTYLTAANGATVGTAAYTASQPRPDVASAFPGYGAAHGYDEIVLGAQPGPITACSYGIDGGVDANALLGCRAVEIRTDPFGSVDSATRVGDQVRLRGWTVDPDTNLSIAVHVYGGPLFLGQGVANGIRPDIGAAFPEYGPAHGFEVFVTAAPGTQVCLYGIDVGPGGNALVGCRTAP